MFSFNFPLPVELTKIQGVLFKLARCDGSKASCLLRGNYVNQKTQKHSFSGNYSWIKPILALFYCLDYDLCVSR